MVTGDAKRKEVKEMSKYTIYPEHEDSIVARWRRVSICGVAGMRIDPNTSQRVSFYSASDESNVANSVVTFSYDTDIIELYSEREAKVFQSLNKAAIESGYLIPFDGTDSISLSNVLSDREIDAMLALHHAKFKKQLETVTSLVALERIKAKVTDNHANAYHKAIAERIETLSK